MSLTVLNAPFIILRRCALTADVASSGTAKMRTAGSIAAHTACDMRNPRAPPSSREMRTPFSASRFLSKAASMVDCITLILAGPVPGFPHRQRRRQRCGTTPGEWHFLPYPTRADGRARRRSRVSPVPAPHRRRTGRGNAGMYRDRSGRPDRSLRKNGPTRSRARPCAGVPGETLSSGQRRHHSCRQQQPRRRQPAVPSRLPLRPRPHPRQAHRRTGPPGDGRVYDGQAWSVGVLCLGCS